MKRKLTLLYLFALIFSADAFAQRNDTLSRNFSLKQCVDFALQNQPQVKQAFIDQQINERDIRIGLSAWLPQVTSSGSYNHYFQTPVANTGATAHNVSNLGLQANQVIYNNDVLLASRAKRYSRQYYSENTLNTQINTVADVSRAFFDVLLSEKQLDILNEDIVRLQRSLKDAYTRYQAGVTDKTDYKQATIALNNSIASRKQTFEAVNSKLAYLKQTMGYAPERELTLQYDSVRLVQEATIDTNQTLNLNNRVEYRQLVTQRTLQSLNIDYYKYGFLPSLSATGAYNLVYFNNNFGGLYNNGYPSSLVGLTINLPIFTGTRRLQNLSKARLQVERVDLDIANQRNVINTEYVQALASYKSNYTNWVLLKQNVDLAKDVYNVVSLQYREGIKTYLDVIVAQSDLRTAELNYYNALFQLLSSKIDLEKALGTLTVR